MKVLSIRNQVYVLFLVFFLYSCSGNISDLLESKRPSISYLSHYIVNTQLPAPASIKSIQLYRTGNRNSPPVLKLGTGQRLTLRFDELSDVSGQYRVSFTHHKPNWENNNLPEHWYLDGINDLIISGGTPNKNTSPEYHHYQLTFPNNQISFETSGNFMLHIKDYKTGIELFSLPFYVTEDAGDIEVKTETIFNAGQRYAPIHQPFSTYEYPDFVEYPEFDLSFYYVQNRFWNKARKSNQFDFIDEGLANFHLSRDRSYAANFDFNALKLNTLSMSNPQIRGWEPGSNPPRVILKEDILNFSADPQTVQQSVYGNPTNSRNARYVNVLFRFEDGNTIDPATEIYLTGDFNQWMATDDNRLTYNSKSGFWETTALIKQGSYRYKYAIRSGSSLNDVILSDTITNQSQEYISFVYYLDPTYKFHRLLQAKVFYAK